MTCIKFVPALVCALVLLFGCAAKVEEEVNGWKVSQQNYDRSYLVAQKDATANGTYKQINSIIIIKDGELLVEEYFNDASRNDTHDPRSVGKTFASAVLGIALDEAYMKSIDQRLSDFYDLREYHNFSAKKQSVTLRNLVTMSSGFEGDDNDPDSPGNEENMYPQNDWVRWTLNLPMARNRNPGDSSIYFTAGVVVLGDILNKSVPDGLEHYAHEKLFKPLGIRDYEWQYTPQNVPNTAGGIRLTPLDFAKFGQLYLSRGKWNDQQIISEQWMNATMTRHYETSFNNNGYGYLMWNKQYKIGNSVLETFYCSGNGGNKIFIFDALNAVVVITASAYNQGYAHPQVDEMMERYILPLLMSVK